MKRPQAQKCITQHERRRRAKRREPLLSTNTTPEIVWGAAEIGRVIGRTERQTFHLLESGALPATKVKGSWCASRAKLIARCSGD